MPGFSRSGSTHLLVDGDGAGALLDPEGAGAGELEVGPPAAPVGVPEPAAPPGLPVVDPVGEPPAACVVPAEELVGFGLAAVEPAAFAVGVPGLAGGGVPCVDTGGSAPLTLPTGMPLMGTPRR